MNIIKRDNQRAAIHISKQGNAFLARAILFIQHFDGSYIPQVVGVQLLSEAQVLELRNNTAALKAHNIILIDTTTEETSIVVYSPQSFGLTLYVPAPRAVESFTYIPSPYISRIQAQYAFSHSQFTRGPNLSK